MWKQIMHASNGFPASTSCNYLDTIPLWSNPELNCNWKLWNLKINVISVHFLWFINDCVSPIIELYLKFGIWHMRVVLLYLHHWNNIKRKFYRIQYLQIFIY